MVSPRDPYLSPADIELLTQEIQRDYSGNQETEKIEEAISLLPHIKYNHSFESTFGTTFNDKPEDERNYWQAKDKIQAFFKHGTSIISITEGGRRRNKRRTARKRRAKKRRSRKSFTPFLI